MVEYASNPGSGVQDQPLPVEIAGDDGCSDTLKKYFTGMKGVCRIQ